MAWGGPWQGWQAARRLGDGAAAVHTASNPWLPLTVLQVLITPRSKAPRCKLRDISADCIGSLVTFRGIVTQVGGGVPGSRPAPVVSTCAEVPQPAHHWRRMLCGLALHTRTRHCARAESAWPRKPPAGV